MRACHRNVCQQAGQGARVACDGAHSSSEAINTPAQLAARVHRDAGLGSIVAALAAHLRTLCTASHHLFWADTVSLLDTECFDLSAAAHRQLTDIYLVGLAHALGGVLASFDRSIPAAATVGSADALEIIGG